MTSAAQVPTVRLKSGATMPTIGLGTYEIPDADAAQVIRWATRIGYRLSGRPDGNQPGPSRR
ncbi:hypothetical protein ACWDA9_34770 [Streptomyces sp. NPDC001193]